MEGVQTHRHHLGDDQEEREVQEGAAAPHPGGGEEEVRGGIVYCKIQQQVDFTINNAGR